LRYIEHRGLEPKIVEANPGSFVAYSDENIAELRGKAPLVCGELAELVERMVLRHWQPLQQPAACEYLDQGACRRFNVIQRAIERVFSIFPPERVQVLEREELPDVQIYLHAFVINIYGVLDNLAWVFILERNILATIGARTRVGLFIPATQVHLPRTVRDHLQSTAVSTWYSSYAKNYRDALAHRIPLYVPP
jgi:hypothetical protein